MVSQKIKDLSDDDLNYLEKLLGEQFAKELEADKTWTMKNKEKQNHSYYECHPCSKRYQKKNSLKVVIKKLPFSLP